LSQTGLACAIALGLFWLRRRRKSVATNFACALGCSCAPFYILILRVSAGPTRCRESHMQLSRRPHNTSCRHRHAVMALWQEEATSERVDGRNDYDNVDCDNCCPNRPGTNSLRCSTNSPTTGTTAAGPGPPCTCFRCSGTGPWPSAQ
jgi:hypothetical protein